MTSQRVRVAVRCLAVVVATACGGRTIGEGHGDGDEDVPSDDRLQPFEVGRRWEYRQQLFDPSLAPSCAGPFVGFVSDQVETNGETRWTYHPNCLSRPVGIFIEGDEITAEVDWSTVRLVYAKPPVVEGATWRGNDGITYVWRDEGTVSVEAGTFDRCWRRAWVDDENEYIVLCRGVGLVTSHVGKGNYRLELWTKNF